MSEPLRGTYDPVTGQFHELVQPDPSPEAAGEPYGRKADSGAPGSRSDLPEPEMTPAMPAGGQEEILSAEEKGVPLPDEDAGKTSAWQNGPEPDAAGAEAGTDDREQAAGEKPEAACDTSSGETGEAVPHEEEAKAGADGPYEDAGEPAPANADVKSILYGIEMLHKKIDLKVQNAEAQETLTKTMYAELQEYKKGLYSSIMKPLLMEMIQIRENILKQGTSLLEKDGDDAVMKVKSFLSYADDLADVLEMYDVEAFYTEQGGEFDPKAHKILRKVSTPEESLNRKVARSIADGYRYDGRVIVKENIAVYDYVPQEETTGGPAE